jgi:hypothetical protein
MMDGAGFLGAGISHPTTKHTTKSTASTEELSKQIFCIHSATCPALLQAFFAVLIINLAFLGIGEDFVGVGEIFELLCCLGVVGIFVCLQSAK